MADPMYVSFDNDDFISVRKSLLGSTVSTINILKKYKTFKELRVKELQLKKELSSEIRAAQQGLKNFLESVPKIKEELIRFGKGQPVTEELVDIDDVTKPKPRTEHERKHKNKKHKKIVVRRSKMSKLDSELESIKAKLSSLE